MQKPRPTGVTIIAILNIIGGIIMLIAGIAVVAVGSLLPGVFEEGMMETGALGMPSALVGGAAVAVGAVIIALGIFSFVVAYGMLKGMSWAWTLTVVLSVISIVLNAVSLASGNFGGIVNIIISGIVLYYLYRPHVKAYFGKAPSPTAQ